MRFHEKRVKPFRRKRRRKREYDRLQRLEARALAVKPTAAKCNADAMRRHERAFLESRQW
jgi:hypothetical protein